MGSTAGSPPGSRQPRTLGCVGIVGAGLIGASVGMALTAAGVDVLLRDRDPEQAKVAARAGRAASGPKASGSAMR